MVRQERISAQENDVPVKSLPKPYSFCLARIFTSISRWAKLIINKKRSGLKEHRTVGCLLLGSPSHTLIKKRLELVPSFVVSRKLSGTMRKAITFWAHAGTKPPPQLWAGWVRLVAFVSLFKSNIPSFPFCLVEFHLFGPAYLGWIFSLIRGHFSSSLSPNPNSELEMLWLTSLPRGGWYYKYTPHL